jgi:hypothetical protein
MTIGSMQKEKAMLRNVKDLRGYAIRATDGVIGRVDDFYFDDDDWGIRYLVVDTGSWLSGRKVLISPLAVGHAGWMARRLPVPSRERRWNTAPTSIPGNRSHGSTKLSTSGTTGIRITGAARGCGAWGRTRAA